MISKILPINKDTMNYPDSKKNITLAIPPRIKTIPLYSNTEAKHMYQQNQKDLYLNIKHHKRTKNEFPTIIKIIFCLIPISLLYLYRDDIFRNLKFIK